MVTTALRAGTAGMIALIVFSAPLKASAQAFQMPNLNQQNPYNASFNPYLNNLGVNSPFNPYASNSTSQYPPGGASLPNPFPPYPPYYPYYPYDSAYGYYSGISQVIDSQGKLMISTQQTYLMQEQVKREKMENRRRAFDQWLYERNNTPTVQDEFERSQKLELRRSQNDPPVNEILSAKALNDLLVDMQKLQAKEIRGIDVSLDEEILKKINVIPPGKGNANIGLLKNEVKNEGRFKWPQPLQAEDFKNDRNTIDTLLKQVIGQAQSGQVDSETLKAMNGTVDHLLEDLARTISDMPTSQYIEAKRFLNDFKDALRALGQEDVAHFFSGKYAAKGRTVKDLVENMTRDGLRFAPAVAGDEAAYVALHRFLANYDTSLNTGAASAER